MVIVMCGCYDGWSVTLSLRLQNFVMLEGPLVMSCKKKKKIATLLEMPASVWVTCMHIKLRPVRTALFNRVLTVFVLFSVNRKMHSGMKTYGCELCGKSFLDSLRLRMHLLSHSGTEIKPTQNRNTIFWLLLSFRQWLMGLFKQQGIHCYFMHLHFNTILLSFTTVKKESYDTNF